MKIVVTFAIKEEVVDVPLKDAIIVPIVPGIGKANAAFSLTRAVLLEKPDMVLNIGTAGTQKHSVGDVFVCDHFIDRDLSLLNLPGITSELHTEHLLFNPYGVVNTGDDFVTDSEVLYGDVIDMEAFAEALVCKKMNIPFVSVKYITDVVGKNSIRAWEEKLSDARKGLQRFFESC